MFNFHRYFFIMPTLARFELEVFSRAEKGQPLNADILNGIMGGFFAEGYGSTLEDDPDRTAITWAQFQHLYRFLDVFSGTGTISFTEKTQPEYLFRTLLPQCVSIMARLP